MRRVGIHGAGLIGIERAGGGAGVHGGGAGWWDPLQQGLCAWCAYDAKNASSLANSYLDLTGNGNNCGPGVAPGWAAGVGWSFDGATQYLLTGFGPQNDQSQSVLCQYANFASAGVNNYVVGSGDTTRAFLLHGNRAGAACLYGNGQSAIVAPPLLAGNLGVAGNQGYRNGVADGGALGVWTLAPLGDTAIGCSWRGFPNYFAQVDVIAVAIYDCVLTAPQMLAIATAMAAL